MKPVFLDTVGVLALIDEGDQWHASAVAAYGPLLASKRRMVTTSLVLCECGNAAARTPFRIDIDDLRRRLERRNCVVEIAKEEMRQAWDSYRNSIEGAAGIVDQVSFVAMRRLGIAEAFTNDKHFQIAGFCTLF